MDILSSALSFGSCSRYLRGMVTYYCISLEEALRRAKTAGKQLGCYYGDITLRGGKKGIRYLKGREGSGAILSDA